MTLKKFILPGLLWVLGAIPAIAMDSDEEDPAEAQKWGFVHQFTLTLDRADPAEIDNFLEYVPYVAKLSQTSYLPLAEIITKRIPNEIKIKIAEVLLKNGDRADIDAHFEKESNAIRVAVRLGNLDMFEFLLARKAKLPPGLLNLAARHPDKTLARRLLELGVEPTISAAAWLNDQEILKKAILLSKDKDSELKLGLEVALQNDNHAMAEALLAYGAPPTAFAAATLGNTKLLKHVSRRSINGCSSINGMKMTPLKRALSSGNLAVACELVQLNANTNEMLKEAVESGDVEGLRNLLACGANVRTIYSFGRTIVMLALKSPNHDKMPEILELLIEKKVNLMQKDHQGDTAAHYAARIPSDKLALKILERLQNAGVRLNLSNSSGQKTWDLALAQRNYDAALFSQYNAM